MICGSLFRHKFEGQGYQDVHRIFMSQRKLQLHGMKTHKKFSDTSNTQYQSMSYASAELITYHDLYDKLLKGVTNSKQKPNFNYLEQNIAKGLRIC